MATFTSNTTRTYLVTYVALRAGNNPIIDGCFTMLAAARQGANALVYLDGVLAASTASSGLTGILKQR